MTDTVVWQISHSDLQEVYALTSGGNAIGRLIAESLFLRKFEREQSLLTLTAEERYLALFRKRPNLIREVPLKHLAAYIGIPLQLLFMAWTYLSTIRFP